MVLNPGSLSPQATALTTWPWLLGLKGVLIVSSGIIFILFAHLRKKFFCSSGAVWKLKPPLFEFYNNQHNVTLAELKKKEEEKEAFENRRVFHLSGIKCNEPRWRAFSSSNFFPFSKSGEKKSCLKFFFTMAAKLTNLRFTQSVLQRYDSPNSFRWVKRGPGMQNNGKEGLILWIYYDLLRWLSSFRFF